MAILKSANGTSSNGASARAVMGTAPGAVTVVQPAAMPSVEALMAQMKAQAEETAKLMQMFNSEKEARIKAENARIAAEQALAAGPTAASSAPIVTVWAPNTYPLAKSPGKFSPGGCFTIQTGDRKVWVRTADLITVLTHIDAVLTALVDTKDALSPAELRIIKPLLG